MKVYAMCPDPLSLLSQNWPLIHLSLMMLAVVVEYLGIQLQLHVAMGSPVTTFAVLTIQVYVC